MDMKKAKRLMIYLCCFYWALAIMIYLVAGNEFRRTSVKSDVLSPVASIGEITDGMQISQRMINPADILQSVEIMAGTYGQESDGALHIAIVDKDGAAVSQTRVPAASFVDGEYTTVALDTPVKGHRGETMTLVFTTEGCGGDDPITIYFGNKVTAGRFDVVQSIDEEDLYAVDGVMGMGRLCARVNGVKTLSFYKAYWVIVIAAFILGAVYIHRCWQGARQGKQNAFVLLCTIYCRYNFLIRQLVGRDFKTKYKRSVLGVAWSFLNPLMTMGVQYIVFSTLFRSDTKNYPVYLLSGIVFFNFFSEAVSLGMTSITGNAALIKKVYIPKYIYPATRVLSSLINFVFALIPIFIVMILTGTAFRPSLLLLVFDVLCLLGFVLGMVLLLSTSMTFFQDTQFLWSVVSMMWMYLTPIFYPETIIPQRFLAFYRMNPMYQYVTFARTCIIDGVSPAPAAYLWCMLSSIIVLVLGALVFKKNQDKFVLHL